MSWREAAESVFCETVAATGRILVMITSYVQVKPQVLFVCTSHAYIGMLADEHTDTDTGGACVWMSAADEMIDALDR